MSDIHGEHEAFLHILNSCSGEVKVKITELFTGLMSQQEMDDLATLIYYPRAKLSRIADESSHLDELYGNLIHRLVELCRFISVKHTKAKVRSCMPERYSGVLDELLHIRTDDHDRVEYYETIIRNIIEVNQAPEVIEDLCVLIKALSVDRLHIVGDIFDRGPRADIVMDSLMACRKVDIQWGNHDVLWMGAASGSRTLVATVLALGFLVWRVLKAIKEYPLRVNAAVENLNLCMEQIAEFRQSFSDNRKKKDDVLRMIESI